jgi:peptide/nickel transport system substrate-binding protein
MPKRTSKRAAIATLAVAALITGLAACAPSGGGGEGGETILTVGRSSAAVQQVFNPYLPTTAYQLGSEGMIYEPLVQVNTTKAGDFKPWLATEWEWNDQGTELSLQLRDGVTWTDGEDFTSEDVVYSYELIKEHPELNLTGIQFDTITAPDEHSVVLTFEKPSANFFDKIIYLSIVPEHVYGEIDDVAGYADEKPVGTGAFMLGTFTPGELHAREEPGLLAEGQAGDRWSALRPVQGQHRGLAGHGAGRRRLVQLLHGQRPGDVPLQERRLPHPVVGRGRRWPHHEQPELPLQ